MSTALRSVSPATHEVLGEVPVSSPQQIKAALADAKAIQPTWRALGVEGRAAVLRKLLDVIKARQEDILTLSANEMGAPVQHKARFFDAPIARFEWNLANAAKVLAPETTYEDTKQLHQIHYEPYGVFGVIAPWNAPLSNFTLTALQPLVAGNTVVFKMSEDVPLFGQMLDQAFASAGVPQGVFNQLYGGAAVGEAILRGGVDHIHFTGSTAVGKKLYQLAAEHFIPITLELGGSDAGLVFEDADLDRMIEPIFWAKFINSGQICSSLKRLFVHESRYEELVQKLIAFTRRQKTGNPLEMDTALGPLVSEKQKKLLTAQLQDAVGKGAKILLDEKEKIPAQGSYFGPVLLANVNADMRAGCEELFGPVLPLDTFRTEEEAIFRANDTSYGLSAYVYTEDSNRYKRVAEQLQAGCISHNGISYFRPENPFGGYKHSGLGRSNGKIGLQSCCQIKTVTMEKV